MRRLVLMRHARTEASHPEGDKARRLLPRGRQEAQEAGLVLSRLGIGHGLVSPAVRARETFTALGLEIPVQYHDALYDEGTETILKVIAQTDDEVMGLVVVGHAPTIPGLVAWLAHFSGQGERDRDPLRYPPATFSSFTLTGSWVDLLGDRPPGIRFERVTHPA